jgi:hypothetical protein
VEEIGGEWREKEENKRPDVMMRWSLEKRKRRFDHWSLVQQVKNTETKADTH